MEVAAKLALRPYFAWISCFSWPRLFPVALLQIKRCLNTNVHFKILYKTKKLSSIVSNKDPVPNGQKSDRYFQLRLDEHGTEATSAVHQHLSCCEASKFQLALLNLHDAFETKACVVKLNHHIHQTVQCNTSIVAMNNDFTELCFLESLFNTGIRAAQELVLFN